MKEGPGAKDTARRLPRRELVILEPVRHRLAVIWLGGGTAILTIVILQSLLGRFGDRTQEAWAWLLPTLMPTLGMIVTVLGYTALDDRASTAVVRRTFSGLAAWMSAGYLLMIALTLLVQPFTAADPIVLMQMSNLWLGPCQALVASVLGVLFVSKQNRTPEKHGTEEDSRIG